MNLGSCAWQSYYFGLTCMRSVMLYICSASCVLCSAVSGVYGYGVVC